YADFPVFRVSGNDADKFAALIGGRLPTADQWGVAAGYSPDDADQDGGPYQEKSTSWQPGEFALPTSQPRRYGPMPIGTAKRDFREVETIGTCVKRCFDMASNGFEWTATGVNSVNKISIHRV